jgi:hypothetical protein
MLNSIHWEMSKEGGRREERGGDGDRREVEGGRTEGRKEEREGLGKRG